MNDLQRCYDELGIQPGASLDEVKRAYRDMATVWHPDRFAHNQRLQQKAQDKLKAINHAYNRLKDHHEADTVTSSPQDKQSQQSRPGEDDPSSPASPPRPPEGTGPDQEPWNGQEPSNSPAPRKTWLKSLGGLVVTILLGTMCKAIVHPSTPQRASDQVSTLHNQAQDIIDALNEGPLVIEDVMRSTVNEAEAASLTADLKSRSVLTKVALLSNATVRRDAPSLAAYDHKLAVGLHLPSDAIVIVATEKGVAAVSGVISAKEMAAIVKASVADFGQGYQVGIDKMLARIDVRRGSM